MDPEKQTSVLGWIVIGLLVVVAVLVVAGSCKAILVTMWGSPHIEYTFKNGFCIERNIQEINFGWNLPPLSMEKLATVNCPVKTG